MYMFVFVFRALPCFWLAAVEMQQLRMWIHPSVRISIHTCPDKYTYMYIHVYIQRYMYIHIYRGEGAAVSHWLRSIYVSIHLSIYPSIYIHINIHIYIYIGEGATVSGWRQFRTQQPPPKQQQQVDGAAAAGGGGGGGLVDWLQAVTLGSGIPVFSSLLVLHEVFGVFQWYTKVLAFL